MSQDEFTYLLRQLSPHAQAYKAWQEYAPREWRMTCPYCRDQITGRPSDAKWSAEYTRHLTDGWCTGSEGYMRFMKGAVVEGGESIASGSENRSINGLSGTLARLVLLSDDQAQDVSCQSL